MLIDDQAMVSPSLSKRFWLSDYIYQKRQSEGKRDSASRLGIARRMPRVNRSHEKQYQDTLKMLAKSGQPDPILIHFQQRFNITAKSTTSAFHTTRNKSSLSPRQTKYKVKERNQTSRLKQLSGDLIERIRTETEVNPIGWTPKPPSRYSKMQQKAVFKIKASDEWMHAQQQILKINLKQEMNRLVQRRIKKIRLGIDNRSIEELINQLKN